MRTRTILPTAAILLAAVAVAQDPPFKGEFPPADEADYQHAIIAYRFNGSWEPGDFEQVK